MRYIADNYAGKTNYSGFELLVLPLAIVALLPEAWFPEGLWWARFVCAYAAFLFASLSTPLIRGKEDIPYSLSAKLAALELLPNLAFAFATVLLMLLGIAGYSQIGRPISDFLQHLAALLLMITFATCFKKKAIDVFFCLLSIIALSSFVFGIVRFGLSSFVEYLLDMSVSDEIRACYELHDICLIMPLIVFHYLFFDARTRGNWIRVAMSLLIALIGFKRIAVFALLVVGILYSAVGKRKGSERLENNIIKLILFFFPIIWVFFTSSGLFNDFCTHFGINSMNRNELYAFFGQYVSFNPAQVGMGEGFCVVTLQAIADSGSTFLRGILGVHNDFLRLFVEAGCLGFVGGLLYYIFGIPKWLERRLGLFAARIYLFCMLYAFIVYATDNTTYYLVFQAGLFLIIITDILRCPADAGNPDERGEETLPAKHVSSPFQKHQLYGRVLYQTQANRELIADASCQRNG